MTVAGQGIDPQLQLVAADLREQLLLEFQREQIDGEAFEAIGRIVDREAAHLSAAERETLKDLVSELSFGLGPLEPLLRDPTVDELMVNGPGSVWVERAGKLEHTDVAFESEVALRDAIERILAPLGRRIDEAEPLVDARLRDGSRVNAIIPPLSLIGPTLTIRRFRNRSVSPDELVEWGTLSSELREFLERCVRARLNIIVSGGTGSGKTTTLNALSSFISDGERIVTIEDAAELRLQQPHVIRLESRPPNVEGKGEITIRRLLRNSLRMRPDRIVVGEVRGGEALEMLGAMGTGHDGGLSTVHAGSPTEAIRRIEILALMADVDLPHVAVRDQVANAIDLVVHQQRMRDGSRRVTNVAAVSRGTEEAVKVKGLYENDGNAPYWNEGALAQLDLGAVE